MSFPFWILTLESPTPEVLPHVPRHPPCIERSAPTAEEAQGIAERDYPNAKVVRVEGPFPWPSLFPVWPIEEGSANSPNNEDGMTDEKMMDLVRKYQGSRTPAEKLLGDILFSAVRPSPIRATVPNAIEVVRFVTNALENALNEFARDWVEINGE